MRFSIGHRLFLSVLLAILAVTATGILLMRANVARSFGDYAAQIELDRLSELADALTRQAKTAGGWNFIPAGTRERWIETELARLQRARESGLGEQATRAPSPVAAPAPPAVPQPPAVPSAPALPDAPAPLARAPLPPLPMPPAPPAAPAMPALPDNAPTLALPERITLLDAQGRYLAGRPLPEGASVRRPLLVDGKPIGSLVVARPSTPNDALASAFLARQTDSLAIILGLSVVLSAVAAIALAAHFRRPIHALAAGAADLAKGRLDTRLQIRRSDELGALAESFNQLAARLESTEAQRRQWVADTSHELRTPVAVLRAQIEAMQDGVRPPSTDNISLLDRQVQSLNRLIDELYQLAKTDVGELAIQPSALDAWDIAREVAEAYRSRMDHAGLGLDIDSKGSLPAVADPARLRQVLGNLFENAVRYTDHGGRLCLSGRAEGSWICLQLDDSAPGVPDAALPRLGERFYRVEASRSRAHGGAGLGLALARRLTEAMGGALRFAHSPLGGLRATLTLPAA